MSHIETRGRPRKSSGGKRSELLTIKLIPEQKKQVRLEADRCGTTLSDVVRATAFELIEERLGERERLGDPCPLEYPTLVPEIYPILLEGTEQFLKRIGDRNSTDQLEEDLWSFTRWLQERRQAVTQRFSRSQKLRGKRPDGKPLPNSPKVYTTDRKLAEQVVLRVTPKEKEWLEEAHDRFSRVSGLTSWIRESAMLGVFHSQDQTFRRTIDSLKSSEETLRQVRTEEREFLGLQTEILKLATEMCEDLSARISSVESSGLV
jgi:hypothetical protein